TPCTLNPSARGAYPMSWKHWNGRIILTNTCSPRSGPPGVATWKDSGPILNSTWLPTAQPILNVCGAWGLRPFISRHCDLPAKGGCSPTKSPQTCSSPPPETTPFRKVCIFTVLFLHENLRRKESLHAPQVRDLPLPR